MSDQKYQPRTSISHSLRLFSQIATEGLQPQKAAPLPPEWFLKKASEKSGKKPT